MLLNDKQIQAWIRNNERFEQRGDDLVKGLFFKL